MAFKKTSTEKKMTKIPPKSASPEKIDGKWSKASSNNNNHQTKVWTVHGEPGYCVAYTTSWNKKFKGFDQPLQDKYWNKDPSIYHLNIMGIYSRKMPNCDEPVKSRGWPHKQFLTSLEHASPAQMSKMANDFGNKVTEALNECEFKIPNHFFYAGDVSKEGGTDIKDSLLAKDVIWYCQKSYGYHFDNDDFFQDKNAMRPIFGDMKPDEIKELVL